MSNSYERPQPKSNRALRLSAAAAFLTAITSCNSNADPTSQTAPESINAPNSLKASPYFSCQATWANDNDMTQVGELAGVYAEAKYELHLSSGLLKNFKFDNITYYWDDGTPRTTSKDDGLTHHSYYRYGTFKAEAIGTYVLDGHFQQTECFPYFVVEVSPNPQLDDVRLVNLPSS